ncbi:hypothetical protein GCM10010387_16370 [Streptomyces inusitatus]|uniref:Homeodomain-like domain-containing protein n=1 Tax=Streptomyces inusitatus TaxID=68221 RepID=A0A918PV46_9ACTN|nr:helix-turn-helix domain-containing protein [Streptomyces inusitatus]GGZ23853.1 hypothetical protein GCM10010387_16370 [Streptomyces inusitatus]
MTGEKTAALESVGGLLAQLPDRGRGVIRPGTTWYRGIDLIAVERAMSRRGVCPPLTDGEQRYAAEEMTKAEWSARDIANRLGISSRTVDRWRRDFGAVVTP